MANAVFVRPYEPADQPQIRWLHDRTPPAGQVATSPQKWFPELEDIAANFVAFWVAVERTAGKDSIVGMAGLEAAGTTTLGAPLPDFMGITAPDSLDPTRPTVRLEVMRVAPERQRRGVGRALTQTAIDWAREHEYEAIILNTTPQQRAAVALYEAMGFGRKGTSTIGRYELIWFEIEL